MVCEGALWRLARIVMTAELPAASRTSLEVSLWCYSIDIVSNCKGAGSLLMRASMDQAEVVLSLLWMMLVGCPDISDLTVFCVGKKMQANMDMLESSHFHFK